LKGLKIIILFLTIACYMIPLVNWLMYPKLTQMEIFISWGHFLLLGLLGQLALTFTE